MNRRGKLWNGLISRRSTSLNKENMNNARVPTPEEKELIARLEEKQGYKICAAKNRDLVPCQNRAGKGTDHVGQGRCKYHSGNNQNLSATQWQHGLDSKVKRDHPLLAQKMAEMGSDQEVFDLRTEIAKLRAIAEIMADQKEWLQTAKMAVDVSKVIERLHNIEVGRKYVISIENVGIIIQTVQEAIFRHVPDEFTRHLIATELNSARLQMALPSHKEKVIEAEFTEVVDG